MTAPKGRGLVLYLAVGAAALPGIAAVAAAQEAAGPTVGGSAYEQAYAAYSNGSPPLPSSFSYGSITDLELALGAKGEKARAEATISAQMLTGTAAAIAWSTAAAGLARPDELMLPAYSTASPSMPETVFGARVRTLYVKLDEGAFSALAGRQVVNFGKGVLWSPVDIFDELDLSGLSPDRRGSDALRLSEALGETGSLDLVGAPTFDPAFGRYALRGTGLVGGANLGFLAAREGERGSWEVGGDFKVDLGPSFYGDAVYELPDSGGGSLRAAGGADWSFDLAERKVVIAVQYYYEGTGAVADPLFPGKDNLYASLAWAAGDFFSLSANAIWQIDQEAQVTTLIFTLDAAQNADLDIYAQATTSSPPGTGAVFVVVAGAMLEVKF